MVKPIGLLALPFIGLVWAGTRASTRQRIVGWIKTGVVAVATYALFSALVGGGVGWVRALTTPGEVRTWLSPSTALGMFTGNVASWSASNIDLSRCRVIGDCSPSPCGLFLLGLRATPVQALEWRSSRRALGPVVQPWPLWCSCCGGLTPRPV
jgi:hypothetical protein